MLYSDILQAPFDENRTLWKAPLLNLAGVAQNTALHVSLIVLKSTFQITVDSPHLRSLTPSQGRTWPQKKKKCRQQNHIHYHHHNQYHTSFWEAVPLRQQDYQTQIHGSTPVIFSWLYPTGEEACLTSSVYKQLSLQKLQKGRRTMN